MKVKALIVRPSLLYTYQRFGRSLVFGNIYSKPIPQVQISASNQEKNDKDNTDRYTLHTTPFESSVLTFISAQPRNGALTKAARRPRLLAWVGQPANVPRTSARSQHTSKVVGEVGEKPPRLFPLPRFALGHDNAPIEINRHS